MTTVRKKTLKGQTYYYLEHSIRNGKQIKKKEIYLGRKIPSNIEKIKKDFLNDIHKQRWYVDVDRIKQKFSKEQGLMPKSVRRKELENFVTQFTYDTQRIEGSTLTRRETADLLERGITPKSKPMRDVQEAEAHRDLFYKILKSKKDLSLQMTTDWHWDLFNKTKADLAGKIRKYQVAIGGSKFIPPSPVEVYPMLTEFFQWYNKNKNKMHPVELAALAHFKFVTIHPFGDGNGRISRLIMNFILNRKNYPMLDIPYERRNSYYNSLERSQVKGDNGTFLQWFVKRYIKEYKKYLK
ncbi:MAG: Fic family protein [Thaumarchaeota archaeon]|nr:Fic family protein [Nitrososphaerota archaeon]MDE1839125.1 Fic family protein [Nitrososphaerota archaeon]